MKRSTAALLIAILLHIVLILLFWILSRSVLPSEEPLKPKEERVKISLKERPKVTKSAAVKNEIKKPKSKIAPPMPKGKQLQKIVPPERFIKHTPKPKPVPKKIIKKELPKPKKIAPIPPKKPLIHLKKEQKKPLPKKAVPMEQNLTKAIQKNVPQESSQLFAMLSKKQKQPTTTAQQQDNSER